MLHHDHARPLLGLLLPVELEELGLEKSLLRGRGRRRAGRGRRFARRDGRLFVGQRQRHILGRLVAEQMVSFEVAYRLHDRFQILSGRVGQIESRLWGAVVQRVGRRRQPEIETINFIFYVGLNVVSSSSSFLCLRRIAECGYSNDAMTCL